MAVTRAFNTKAPEPCAAPDPYRVHHFVPDGVLPGAKAMHYLQSCLPSRGFGHLL